MTENTVLGNPKKAVAFLNAFRKDGYINIVAIDPITSKVTGITKPIGHHDVLKFIDTYEGTHNLYFMVNEPFDNSPNNKLKKENVEKIHAVWLDADPKKDEPFIDERARLKNFAKELSKSENPPTYIIDSGGGIQAFWLFDEPIEATKANVTHCEALSRGLSDQYDTDRVQNIDRIMRIPFTTNIPTKKKISLGRKKTVANVNFVSGKNSPSGKRYKKVDFIIPTHAEENEQSINNYDTSKLEPVLPPDLAIKLKQIAKQNEKIMGLYNGTIKKPSRSEYDFTLTKELKWAGFSLDECAQILWCYKHGKNKELTGREIARCFERIDNPFTDLSADYIKNIENQVNPLTAEKEKTTIIDGELPKRLKTIDANKADWTVSGKPLVKGLLDQNTITVMYGQSNTGKSFVATDIAGHIAKGEQWGHHKVPNQMGVLYVCAEAGLSYAKRIAALKRRLNVTDCDLKTFPYEYIAMGVNFLSEKQDIKDVILLVKRQERLTNVKVGMVVVDTLATTFSGGNENSSEDMGLFIENMKFIQEKAQVAVVVVHHSGKDQAAGARGHSSLRAATDTELEVVSDKRGERYARSIRVRKQRDGESDVELDFGLRICELGRDEDDDPITTCSVVLEGDDDFDDMVPSILDGLCDDEKAILDTIKLYETLDLNPDTMPMTKKELMTFLFEKIKSGDGVFVKQSKNGGWTFDVSNLPIIGKPNATQKKRFVRWLDKVGQKGLVEKITFYQ